MKKIFLGVYMMAVSSIAVMLWPSAVGAQVVSANDAYKAIVKINTYSQAIDGFLTNWQSGTGVIIDPKGIILTNEHVVSVKYSYDNSESSVGYQVCLTRDNAQEPDCKYTAKLIAKDENSDLALLQIVPIDGLSTAATLPYIESLQSGSVSINEEVSALGYPEVGGDTISVSRGIISGKQNKYDKNWLKIDAVTSFGSSGGALINGAGKLVGITTEVYSDLAASLGYAVDLNSVMPWINSKKSGVAITAGLQDRIVALTKKQQGQNKSNTFQFDGYDFGITKPSGWEFKYDSEDTLLIHNPGDEDAGYVWVGISRNDHPVDFNYFDLLLKTGLTTNGVIAQTNFVKNEIVRLNGIQAKHVQISGLQSTVEQYYVPNQDVAAQMIFGFGKDDKDVSTVNTILNSLTKNSRPAPVLLQSYTNESPAFSLQTNADWYIRTFDSKNTPFELFHKDFTAKVEMLVEKKTEQTRSFSNNDILQVKEKAFENAAVAAKNLNLLAVLGTKDAHARLSNQVTDTIQFEIKDSNLSTGETLLYIYTIIVPTPNEYITFSMRYFGTDRKKFEEKVASLKGVLSTLSFSSSPQSPIISENIPTQPVVVGKSGTYDRDAERTKAISVNSDKKVSAEAGSARCTSGALIKSKSSPAVYYCGANGKRFVFPNLQTYMTWYENFNGVITLTDEELANVPIGGLVTYRPGTRMIKIESSPTVYAVAANGELRPIGSEAVAKRLYGNNWNKMIDDISDAFFVNYRIGDAINE